MPTVKQRITITYSKEDIKELILADIKSKFPTHDLVDISYNVKEESDYFDRYSTYKFDNIEAKLEPNK